MTASLVKHVRMGFNQLVPFSLKVQPADVLATPNMLTAVAGAVRRHQARWYAAGIDHQLLLAAPFQRDKPKSGCFDGAAAGGNQAVF